MFSDTAGGISEFKSITLNVSKVNFLFCQDDALDSDWLRWTGVSGFLLYLLLQVFVGRVPILWVNKFFLEGGMRQEVVLHLTLQS